MLFPGHSMTPELKRLLTQKHPEMRNTSTAQTQQMLKKHAQRQIMYYHKMVLLRMRLSDTLTTHIDDVEQVINELLDSIHGESCSAV